MRNPGLVFLFPALLLLACEARPLSWTSALQVSGPYPLADRVMWMDATRGIVFSLDPTVSPPTVKTLVAGLAASFATPTPEGRHLMVLTAGKEATKPGETPVDPTLLVIDSAADGPHVARTYLLTAPFDRLALSPDGAWAIAYYSDSPPDDTTFFRNPNELAVVDLGAPPGDKNPLFRTIRSLGSAPLGIVYSPPLAIPAGGPATRSLAVALARNYLTFVDLGHPERAEITVPLVPGDSTITVTPRQIVFAPDSATAFVRADGSADVFGISLEARVPVDATQNDFFPRINQPSSGKTALDMILYAESKKTMLLVANSSSDLAVIDAATSEFAVLPVGVPVDAILGVPAAHPTTAILYSRGRPQSFVHFLDLTDLSTKLAHNLTRRALAQPVHDLVATPDENQLIVVHDDARTVLSILDLGPRRTDTPIQGHVVMESYAFSGSRYLAGVSSSLLRLGILDLTTLATRDIRLDHPPVRVLAVGTRLVVDHGSPGGLVTVVPDPTSAREDTRVLSGFFLQSLFENQAAR